MRKLYIPFFVFAFSFIYYIFQACPTFYFWDSAELSAAVMGGGVPHPPGFPSLLIIAKLWAKVIPLGKAYGLNLMSAFFAAVGLMFWYLVTESVLRKLSPEKNGTELAILSLIAVTIFGSSFSFSIQAVRFEVYSLNFACFSILVFLALRLSSNAVGHKTVYTIMMVVVAAISLGGHHFTMALTFPGILLIFYLHNKLRLRYLIYFMVSTIILLVPLYFSIYLLALKNPVLNWGDPSGWRNFIDYFLLKEFSTPISNLAPGHLAQNLSFSAELIIRQIGVLGFLLGLWGIVKSIRLSPELVLPFTVILIPNIFSIIYFEEYFYENYDQHGYILFSVAIFALFMVVTLGFLSGYIRELLREKLSEKSEPLGFIVLLSLAAIVIFMPMKKNLFSANLSQTRASEEFAELFLNEIPEDALIITSYYSTYFCLLAYDALNPSEDNKIIANVYNWDHEWGRNQMAAFLGFSPERAPDRSDFYRKLLNNVKDQRPIYVEYDKASAPLINFLTPSGLSYKFSISDTSFGTTVYPATEIESYFNIAKRSRDIESTRIWVLWFMNRGQFYLNRGERDLANWYFEVGEKIASRGKQISFKIK